MTTDDIYSLMEVIIKDVTEDYFIRVYSDLTVNVSLVIGENKIQMEGDRVLVSSAIGAFYNLNSENLSNV